MALADGIVAGGGGDWRLVPGLVASASRIVCRKSSGSGLGDIFNYLIIIIITRTDTGTADLVGQVQPRRSSSAAGADTERGIFEVGDRKLNSITTAVVDQRECEREIVDNQGHD